LASENNFDKIFLKASRSDWQKFLGLGYMLEGILRYYFHGEDAYVLSKFRSIERVTSEHLIKESTLIENLMKTSPEYKPPPIQEGYQMVLAGEEHIPEMVRLYRRIFKTYPSPLTHPDYIYQTMHRHVLYRAFLNARGEVVSAASAEIDYENSNAELTDCATRERERGKGLMYHLLRQIEQDLLDRNIQTGYTLARAPSIGMNRVFYRLGYEYSGRLINNCDISGQYEDMNIWVKNLNSLVFSTMK
jgi:beta-lysine N6-acetyltransferase